MGKAPSVGPQPGVSRRMARRRNQRFPLLCNGGASSKGNHVAAVFLFHALDNLDGRIALCSGRYDGAVTFVAGTTWYRYGQIGGGGDDYVQRPGELISPGIYSKTSRRQIELAEEDVVGHFSRATVLYSSLEGITQGGDVSGCVSLFPMPFI